MEHLDSDWQASSGRVHSCLALFNSPQDELEPRGDLVIDFWNIAILYTKFIGSCGNILNAFLLSDNCFDKTFSVKESTRNSIKCLHEW